MNSYILHSGILLFLPAAAALVQPASAQNVIPPPGPPITRVAAGDPPAAVSYQCVVKARDGSAQKTVVEADSQDKARRAAVDKVGPRSTGVADVTCTRAADTRAAKAEVKTRAPTPPVYEPSRSGIKFAKDGSCKLSPQALAAHPDARDKCGERPALEGGSIECPAEYCAALRGIRN